MLLFLACAPLHLLSKALFRRSSWPRHFLRIAARIAGVRVVVEGAPVTAPGLLLANHLSWLDILVLGSATGCAFVSKDDLGHGLVHWLADQNATIYVRRSDVRGARNQAHDLARGIAGAKPVALFPEGTVGPGDRLLPFRSTLLEAVRLAETRMEVRPVALDYGAAATDISWYDEPALANAIRVLGRPGVLPVTVRLLPPLDPFADRKQLAADARAAISAALGFKSDAHSPIAAAG